MRSACGAGARPAMPEPILEADAIVRTYAGANGVLAVRGASLALAPKDFVALMGPSGSGKTTFIGVLSGLDRPDEGEVRWKGAAMGSLSAFRRRTLRRTEMGVVFQSFGLLPTLSAVENVELPLRFGGTTLDEARERAAAWLTRLGPPPPPRQPDVRAVGGSAAARRRRPRPDRRAGGRAGRRADRGGRHGERRPDSSRRSGT